MRQGRIRLSPPGEAPCGRETGERRASRRGERDPSLRLPVVRPSRGTAAERDAGMGTT